MTGLYALVRRNSKLFFKDKGMFFTSLITPMILLVLYVTFLGKVYRDAFTSSIPSVFEIDESLLNGLVGGQLISSLLAVCCVTVAFCSNLLMVQDKVSGAHKDLTMTPVSPSVLALGYFLSSAAVTLLICLAALAVSVVYLAMIGWYMTVTEIALLVGDVVLLVLFGTALSSLINRPLTTNGQASAVGTIVSSAYGFICGAYMPMANFGEGLQMVLSFLPGTYGTVLLRHHAINRAFEELADAGVPAEVVHGLRDGIDCNLYFFDEPVPITAMYTVLISATAALMLAYVVMCRLRKTK